MVHLDRHVGSRAWDREVMSWWLWEFVGGLVSHSGRFLASVSPGVTAAVCVQRDVSITADGFQCHVGRVTVTEVSACFTWVVAPFPGICAHHGGAGPFTSCPGCCTATDFCPIIANKNLSNTGVSLLTLWLHEGTLIPDPLQPAFTKEQNPTPSIAWPPKRTGETSKQALPPILRGKTLAAALDLQLWGEPAELPALVPLISSHSSLNPARYSR